jgi:hypothetical protein
VPTLLTVCDVCGETDGPGSYIRPEEYEWHGLLRVDPATTPWEDE